MTETMKLQDILSDLQNIGGSGVEKTAAQNTPPAGQTVKTARSELVEALDSAMTTPKVAEVVDATPMTDKVIKIASDLANSEGEALTKEAHIYGAAVADGFMARIGQYEQAAGNTKVASAGEEEQDFEKFAAENPELTKQAVELGYLHGKTQIEQAKIASFNQGYTDGSAEIQELSKTAEGRVKLAQIAAEQTAASENQEKIAAETSEQRGYEDTIRLLEAM